MKEYLLRAFQQEHYENTDEFLSAIELSTGSGKLLELHKLMCSKYGLPSLGTSRVSYTSKSVVFKVPISQDGFKYNDYELSLCGFHDCVLARTKMVFPLGIEVLVMEYVERADRQEISNRLGHIPDWIDCIDMEQVGFTKSGILKAYDYGDLLSHI